MRPDFGSPGVPKQVSGIISYTYPPTPNSVYMSGERLSQTLQVVFSRRLRFLLVRALLIPRLVDATATPTHSLL